MFSPQKTSVRQVVLVAAFIIPLALIVRSALSTSHQNMEETQTTEKKDSFACAVNCMDGRVQRAVEDFMKKNYGVDWVDEVTEAGPSKILADNSEKAVVSNIKKRLGISVHHHGTKVIAIVGHFGCAGNPVSKEEQLVHMHQAKKRIENFKLGTEVILLWVDQGWRNAELVK